MSTDPPNRPAIVAALSTLSNARNEDLLCHVGDINRLYLRLKPVGSARSPSSDGSTDRLGCSSGCGSSERRTGCDRVKRPKQGKKAGFLVTVDTLLKSVKNNEPQIRNLLEKTGSEMIHEGHTNEDVRISDIQAGEGPSVAAKFRRILASRSLVMEFEQWKTSTQRATLKSFSNHISVAYEIHKRKFHRARQIIEYEQKATPAISIVFVFSWSHAVSNKNIIGFIDRLKKENEELYGFLEEKAEWLDRCQSLYNDRCVSINKARAPTPTFILYQPQNDVQAQGHGGGKRKSLPTQSRESRKSRRRVTEGQVIQLGTENEARSQTAQGTGAVSMPVARDINDEQANAPQDAPRSADQSRQSRDLVISGEVLQAQYDFPIMPASEGTRCDATQLVAEQSGNRYLPVQYGLVHQQAQDMGYRRIIEPDGQYMAPSSQYIVDMQRPLLQQNSIWWDESFY